MPKSGSAHTDLTDEEEEYAAELRKEEAFNRLPETYLASPFRLLLKPEGEKQLAADRFGTRPSEAGGTAEAKAGSSKLGRPPKKEGPSDATIRIVAALAKHHGYQPHNSGPSIDNDEPASLGTIAGLGQRNQAHGEGVHGEGVWREVAIELQGSLCRALSEERSQGGGMSCLPLTGS